MYLKHYKILRLDRQERENDGGDEAEEGRKVIPVELLTLEQEHGDDGEYGQRDHLLDDLKLEQTERAAVTLESDTVGRNHEAIFGQGDAPREQDDGIQGPVAGHAGLLEAQMAVPGQGHEDVGYNQQKDCDYYQFHIKFR